MAFKVHQVAVCTLHPEQKFLEFCCFLNGWLCLLKKAELNCFAESVFFIITVVVQKLYA